MSEDSESIADALDSDSGISGKLGNIRDKWGGQILLIAFLGGLLASYIHWTGLVFAGVFIGLFSSNMKSALLNGLVFGTVFWILFVIYLVLNGALDGYTGMGQIFYLSIGISLGIPMFSASVRGLL